MGKFSKIVDKFLPWEVNLAKRAVQHVEDGTTPSRREVKGWLSARRTRVMVGTGVAASAATATLMGVPGFAEDGLEGKFVEHARNTISHTVDLDGKGIQQEIAAVAATIRHAGERAYEDPSRVPKAIARDMVDDGQDHLRNLATTVALIEAGTITAGAWRRRGDTEHCWEKKSPQVSASAPPDPAALPTLPAGNSISITISPPPTPQPSQPASSPAPRGRA